MRHCYFDDQGAPGTCRLLAVVSGIGVLLQTLNFAGLAISLRQPWNLPD